MKITEAQLADAALRYVGGAGLMALAPRYGIAHTTLRDYLRSAGVQIRGTGHYATPRPNEYATPETWRCTKCGRGQADGAQRSATRASWCNACNAAYTRGRYAARRVPRGQVVR